VRYFLTYAICDDGGITFKEKFNYPISTDTIDSMCLLENYIILFDFKQAWVLSLEGKIVFEYLCKEWDFADCWKDEMYILSKSGILSRVKLG